MRILIIRHGDPDYEHDSLTPEGWEEARLLSEYLDKTAIDYAYVSPLGRAKDTASFTLQKKHMQAVECDWLREFPALIRRPDRSGEPIIAWDWLPKDWTEIPEFFDKDRWNQVPVMKDGNVEQLYNSVIRSLDQLLEQHGYLRENQYYRAVKSNTDTLVFFCHFGLACVLLSHLLNISPMALWHGLALAPSSVSILNTEERREGIAYFRASCLGDTSHLYAGGKEPSFACRFCECYENKEERHD